LKIVFFVKYLITPTVTVNLVKILKSLFRHWKFHI